MLGKWLRAFLGTDHLGRNAVFEKSYDGVIVLDDEDRVVDFNASAVSFFDRHGISLKKGKFDDLVKEHPSLAELFNTYNPLVYRIKDDSSKSYYEVKTELVTKENGSTWGMAKIIRDISNELALQEELNSYATTDQFTGLFNRKEFFRLAKECLDDVDSMSFVYLLTIDIDSLKRINDIYGHVAGDYVIKFITQMMQSSFRKTDILGRLDGEEFGVLMFGSEELNIYEKTEEFRHNIENMAVIFEKQLLKVTISMGFAEYNRSISDIDHLMKNAYEALYLSKKNGRNKVTGV